MEKMKRELKKVCGVEGCKNPYYAKGYCHKHRFQVRKYGRLTSETERKTYDRTVEKCKADGCNLEIRCNGYCAKHNLQIKKFSKIMYETQYNRITEDSVCNIEGCNNKVRCKGLCSSHYQQNIKTKKKKVINVLIVEKKKC